MSIGFFKSRMLGAALLVLTALACCISAQAQESMARRTFEQMLEVGSSERHLHAAWESRYVSEGRDNLDGDSLLTATFETSGDHLVGSVWYGNSPEQDYDELQLSLALIGALGAFEGYFGYTHIRLPFANLHDHEIGAGVLWTGLPCGILIGADAYYSVEASGTFAEAGISREYEIMERLSFRTTAVFGMNFGYVSDGHEGANHVAVRCDGEYELSESFSLVGHLAYNWGIGQERFRPGDASLGDFLHGGVGIRFSF